MDNNKFIFIFTKTRWDEAPRIRHQLVDLLRKNGKKVVFFQKASHKPMKSKITKIDEGFYLVNYYELLHHQLKYINFFNYINDVIVKKTIGAIVGKFNIEYVINFNYDYTFLRDIFPEQRIITIINDDFIAQAKKYRRKEAKKLLMNTCSNSDKVLCVSYSLVNQLEEYNSNTYLFLPWALKKYVKPSKNIDRDTVLFYGYINNRIDWNIINNILSEKIKIRFIGPIAKNCLHIIEKYIQIYSNFEYDGTSKIDDLFTDDVVLSIIPYKIDSDEIKAITINNKSFNLLSKGLPLLYPDLPNLIECNNYVIMRYKNINDIVKAFSYYKDNFLKIQNEIEVFLGNHYSKNRYKYFE